jgi:mycothiol synthase
MSNNLRYNIAGPLAERYQNDAVRLPDSPRVPGLTFRRFRGEADYPAMWAIIEGSKGADQVERTDTVKDVARNYRHLFNCDPYRDMLFAEVDGEPVGYSRVWWQEEPSGARRYEHFAYLLPEWRHTGIRRALLRANERRLREIAAEHLRSAPDINTAVEMETYFQLELAETETHWHTLLLHAGYEPIRYGYMMVRPDLENIPDLPLPEGLEVRPVQPEHYMKIWYAAEEAFRDHWGQTEWQDEWFNSWKESPTFQPHLWQIAWDGDQVAGAVQNFINYQENEEYGRQRGYTENIFVRRPWRRQGLAKALIARSFHVHRAQGMTEAALGVDAENPNGALQLYESMGFRVVKTYITVRKPLV